MFEHGDKLVELAVGFVADILIISLDSPKICRHCVHCSLEDGHVV